MASYFFLAMACVSTIKPLQASLYLSKVKFDWKLPLIYAGLALLAVPIAALHRRLTSRYAHLSIASGTVGFFTLSLAIFAFALSQPRGFWTCSLFVVWSGIFSLLLPTLGWVMAYDLFTVREAKRLFALLGTGGILGGICGSYCTALVGRHLLWLLIQVMLMLVLLQGLMLLIYRANRSRNGRGRHTSVADPASETGQPRKIRELLASHHARCLAGVVLAVALATTVIDLNYQWYASHVYQGTLQDLTRLFGFVSGTMGLLAAVLQIFASRRILQRFGLPVALLVPPLSLGAGSLLVAFRPQQLWPVVGVRMLDGTLRPSFHLTGMEMSYVILADRRTALPIKSFVDLAVSRCGDALGAFLFLMLSGVLAYQARLVAGIQVLLVALWGYLALQLGKDYVRHLRSAVRNGAAIPQAAEPEEGREEEILLETLQSSDPVRIRLALLQMKQLDPRRGDAAPEFPFQGENLLQTHLFGIGSGEIRWREAATALLEHPDPGIGAAAFHLLVRRDPALHLKSLRQHLASEWLPPLCYLHYLDQYVERTANFLNPAYVLRWCQNLPSEQRCLMARLIGKSGSRAYLPVLRQWALEGPSLSARAAIEALGHFAEPRFLSFLSACLCARWSSLSARKALVLYGEAAVDFLVGLLQDPNTDPRIKREIPLVLGSIRCSASRAALVNALYQPDALASYRALKALNRARDVQDLSFTAGTFLPVIDVLARQYYGLASLESIKEENEGSGWKLLRRTLSERKTQILEKVFLTLDLFLPRGDAYYSYQILTRDRDELRDHAIELIDAQLNPHLKQTMLPLLTEQNVEELARTGRRLYQIPDAPAAILSEAILEADPWLRCCLMAAVRESAIHAGKGRGELMESVRRCCDDINPLVRETAIWTLEGIQS
jgi:AAA family ATP:ADP antiporter